MIVFKDTAPSIVFIIKSAVAFVLMTASFVLYVVAYSKALKEVRLSKQRAESEGASVQSVGEVQNPGDAEQGEYDEQNAGQAAVGREE